MSLIEIKNLRKEFSDSVPLKDVNATIEEGEVITIIGPSGTGKSTFLRCINGLEKATSGSVIVDGDDVCSPKTNLLQVRKKMGMVFQSFNLFGHKTVLENVMMPQQDLKGASKQEAYDEAILQLKKVGLEEKVNKYPDELSGGQKQRVAIARALAMHPKIILFDEPTSALDPTMVTEVLSVIRKLAGTGLTMLIVTHEMRIAKNISDRVFYMDEGVVYESGTPEEIFENPKKEKTKQFVYGIRNFTYRLEYGGNDIINLLAEVETFCRDQFMNKKAAMNLNLAIEEITVSNLVPSLEFAEKGHIDLIIRAGESGRGMELDVDYSDIKDVVNPFDGGWDEISEKILSKIIKRKKSGREGVASFEIQGV